VALEHRIIHYIAIKFRPDENTDTFGCAVDFYGQLQQKQRILLEV
jgi:hypothetical protein